jgi:hypothetical protein
MGVPIKPGSAWLGAVTGLFELLSETVATVANSLSAEYTLAEKQAYCNLILEKRHGCHRQQESSRVRQTATYTPPVADRDLGDDQGAVRDHEYPQS